MGGAFGNIIQIGDVLISEDVVTEWFCCDYQACKGQCCISGDCGAPMLDWEADSLREQYPDYQHLMLTDGRAVVSDHGYVVIGPHGKLGTPLIPCSEICAYSHFREDGSLLCAIEMAGGIKPQSCSLYPIRVTRFAGGGQAMNVHNWSICQCARDKGLREGIRVYQFLKGPLTRIYGEAFYKELCAAAESILKI